MGVSLSLSLSTRFKQTFEILRQLFYQFVLRMEISLPAIALNGQLSIIRSFVSHRQKQPAFKAVDNEAPPKIP